MRCDGVGQAVISSLAALLSKWQKETSDPWLCSPHAGPSVTILTNHHQYHEEEDLTKVDQL